MVNVKLSAGFVAYQLAGWSRYQSVLDTMQHALSIGCIPIQSFRHPVFEPAGLRCDVLRMDQIHPIVSGNKWFKLRYNLAQAQLLNLKHVISFGGAWSNHLHALAFACHRLGLRLRAVVRGDEWHARSTPLLDDLRHWGVDVVPVSRQEYRRRNDRAYQHELAKRFPGHYVIPEGGDNVLGLMGVANFAASLSEEDRCRAALVDDIWLACGTGNTLLGIRLAFPQRTRVTGVSALKGQWYEKMIAGRMQTLWPYPASNWRVFTEFHGGGFAKLPTAIKDFMVDCERSTGIPLDPVYTVKLCYALVNLADQGALAPEQRLLVIHTGGLQGRRSLDTDPQ